MATRMFQTIVLMAPTYRSDNLVEQGREAQARADAIERRQGEFWNQICERLAARLKMTRPSRVRV